MLRVNFQLERVSLQDQDLEGNPQGINVPEHIVPGHSSQRTEARESIFHAMKHPNT